MAMRIESKLCHLSENKVIVQVNGWVNDQSIGSALAEAESVEVAEDKAIIRLQKRLEPKNNKQSNIIIKNDDPIINQNKEEISNTDAIKDKKVKNNDPIDWSNELTAIDSQIKRLNWTREDEVDFLEKNMGYNNRNKITNYNELVNYLNILKKIGITNSNNTNKVNINNLINESELILNELSWDHKKGREYLQKEFNVSTRKELDETQLLSFVNNLKLIRNQKLSNFNLTK